MTTGGRVGPVRGIRVSKERTWPAVADEALVERLIPAIQRTIVEETRRHRAAPDGDVDLDAPDVSNVLLMLLATLLEPSPVCSTPAGVRRMAEAAGRELGLLMRDVRRLKVAEMREGGSTR